MPLIQQSTYTRPPFYLFNGHLQTIVPSIFRKVPGFSYRRERISTPDEDFLDLDWLQNQNRRLLVLSHGLEGNTERGYIRGMAKYFHERGWDILAWNCRSCSGEINRQFKLYHHGDIEDISLVIQHAIAQFNYEKVALAGFSMGGSITLNYLGKLGKQIPPEVCLGIAFSTPCDLRASSQALDLKENRIFKNKFLEALKIKISIKNKQFPGRIDMDKFDEIEIWKDFDDYFSAPLCGFADADEFYERSSAKNFMAGTTVPTLLVNAQNDPILTEESSPKKLCDAHSNLYLETPQKGGHVNFPVFRSNWSWAEYRSCEFINFVLK